LKIDENLPREYASLLRDARFEADTVEDEGLAGSDDSRVTQLLTPDLRSCRYSGIAELIERGWHLQRPVRG
jgi:hypothetical protein